MKHPLIKMYRGRVAKPAILGMLLVPLIVWPGMGSTAPHVPKDDATVIARLPTPAIQPELQLLRAQARARPDDPLASFALAQRYLEIGRADADPRFISYAEATLTPWLNRPTPPAQALVLQAIAVQYLHRFDEALDLLERALHQDPDNAQAWLTKAGLLQVKGHLLEADAACRSMLRVADRVVALTCLTSVDSARGNLASSYERMRALLPATRSDKPATQAWMLNQMAEMAIRLGNSQRATQHLSAALAVDPENAVAKAMYADVLIEAGEWQQALDLLRHDSGNDVLLLRLAIAAKHHGADGKRLADLYEARLHAARQRGEGDSHLREHARFMLDVKANPAKAVALAVRNFINQREPEDVRLLLRAAKAADQWNQATAAISWISQHNYEDAQVSAILSGHRAVRL